MLEMMIKIANQGVDYDSAAAQLGVSRRTVERRFSQYSLTQAGYTSPKCRSNRRKEDPHPLRNRRARFGELVQMDGSNHTVFTSPGHPSSKLEKETGTQFQIAAAKLGVQEIHTSSIPQAKGRIERANETMQDRLISEMRLAKIETIEQANEFLPWFIKDHNERYALDTTALENAFYPASDEQTINVLLSVVNERMVNSGNVISYKARNYAIFNSKCRQLIKPGTKVLVLKTLDDRLLLLRGEEVYNLLATKTMTLPLPEDLKDKVYIPPKEHPLKEASYKMMIQKLRRAA